MVGLIIVLVLAFSVVLMAVSKLNLTPAKQLIVAAAFLMLYDFIFSILRK